MSTAFLNCVATSGTTTRVVSTRHARPEQFMAYCTRSQYKKHGVLDVKRPTWVLPEVVHRTLPLLVHLQLVLVQKQPCISVPHIFLVQRERCISVPHIFVVQTRCLSVPDMAVGAVAQVTLTWVALLRNSMSSYWRRSISTSLVAAHRTSAPDMELQVRRTTHRAVYQYRTGRSKCVGAYPMPVRRE